MRLRRLAMVMAGAVGAWGFGAPAGASGDYGCSPDWTLGSDALGCASAIVMAPGNDTRVNLALLLRDRGGLASQPGSYPPLDWDYGYAHNFFSWGIFSTSAYSRAEEPENDFYGSRCVSLKGGDAAFTAAIAANPKLLPAERQALIAARGQLQPICASFGAGYWMSEGAHPKAPPPAWPVEVQSKVAKEFLAYLLGAAAFYGEDWNGARNQFSELSASIDPWLKETARYMIARVELNAAQATSFDEWGFFSGPDSVDQVAAARGAQALAAYLNAYPKGRYSGSAKGLQRRALWLQGDLGALADGYEAMLGLVAPGSAAEAQLIEEIDNKLLLAKGAASAIDTPLLLATYDLMRMRGGEEDDLDSADRPAIDAAELARQAALFKGHEALYNFLRATYSFYVAGDAQDVLGLIPDASGAAQHSALDFSRQILRGQALAALKDPAEEAFWLRLIGGSTGIYQRPAAELGLALHWESSGNLARVFAANSPIDESMIRKILLEHAAGAQILRAQAVNGARPQGERALALFTLVYKQLSHGNYAGFLSDAAQIPADADSSAGLWNLTGQDAIPLGLFTNGRFSDGYACPALKATAARLARNPKDGKGLLCLGDFYRLNGFDGFDEFAVSPAPGSLGGNASLFPGSEIPRGSFYPAVIADPAAERGDKAYALYRAVRCYAPSGYNGCGGEEVAEAQRKAWFTALKRQYADTRWAKELQYYW